MTFSLKFILLWWAAYYREHPPHRFMFHGQTGFGPTLSNGFGLHGWPLAVLLAVVISALMWQHVRREQRAHDRAIGDYLARFQDACEWIGRPLFDMDVTDRTGHLS